VAPGQFASEGHYDRRLKYAQIHRPRERLCGRARGTMELLCQPILSRRTPRDPASPPHDRRHDRAQFIAIHATQLSVRGCPLRPPFQRLPGRPRARAFAGALVHSTGPGVVGWSSLSGSERPMAQLAARPIFGQQKEHVGNPSVVSLLPPCPPKLRPPRETPVRKRSYAQHHGTPNENKPLRRAQNCCQIKWKGNGRFATP
jgi:hypothetical protein